MGLDIEATQLEPLSAFVRERPYFLFGPIKLLAVILHVTFIPTMNMIRTFTDILLGKQQPHLEQLLLAGPLVLALLLDGWAGLMWMICAHTLSMYWLLIASFPVHRSEFGWTPGCDERVPAQPTFSRCVSGLTLTTTLTHG